MRTPILTTERLLLRPLYISDAEVMYENIGTDPDVAKYMLWNLHQSIDDTIEWLAFEESMVDSDEFYSWAIVLKETDKLIGSGGFRLNKENDIYEIGYDIMKDEWNKGYVSEFAREALKFATEVLGQKQIAGRHAKENPASGRVMEKVGFVYQKDGVFYSLDNKRKFDAKEYLYQVK